MTYRNEIKHIITAADKAALCSRLRAVASPDRHAGADGSYVVRSLYFDNLYDKALREKLDGINAREKFRLRLYNGNDARISLEKKSKRNGLGTKISCPIHREEVERLLAGDTDWMPASGRGLIVELYSKMRSQCLRPKTIVEYTRTPFVYVPGNVRITVDEDLRTGLGSTDFLSPRSLLIPAGPPLILLEVKWDGYLPWVIRSAVRLDDRRATAFSKYAACRIYD